MKNFTIKSYVAYIFLIAIAITACTKKTIDPELSTKTFKTPQTRTIPTPEFDWANADWMPVPVGQSAIPSPWNGAGSISYTYGMDITNDRYPDAGWELLYNTFDENASGPLINPYFILYNKYRGTLRIYLYLTTQFVVSSSYLQDGIAVVSNHQTSLLSYLGKEIIDPEERYKTTDYIQIQGSPDNLSPMAANKWYMMQYELAYDPNIVNIPYNQIQLSWYLNYCNVQTITLGGTQEGQINGTIGAASSTNFYDQFKSASEASGTAVLAGIGENFISNNAVDDTEKNNKLGLPNSTFSQILSGLQDALKSSISDIPNSLFKGLSAIFGSNQNKPLPVNLVFESQIELSGDLSERGAFPSSPCTFWIPGTNIATEATGYIPSYNIPLGVILLDGRPKVRPMIVYERTGNGYNAAVTYRGNNFRSHLIINPAIEAIANIEIKSLDLVEINSSNQFLRYLPRETFIGKLNSNYEPITSLKVPNLATRAIIQITPKNGDKPSIIIKTFKTDQDPLPLKNAE